MVGAAVVAFTIVLHRELPVALLEQIVLMCDLAVCNVVRGNVRLHGAAHDAKVLGRCVRETDEDKARKTLHMHGLQRKLAAIEVFSNVLIVDELAAPVVSTLVIRANQPVEGPATRIAQARPSVATDVVKGAHRHITIAHDNDRVVSDLYGEELARLRDLRFDAREDPIAAENPLNILFEHFRT
jgi:hypothetical protein